MKLNEKFLTDYFKKEEHLFYMCTEEDVIDSDAHAFPFTYLSVIVPLSGTIEFKTSLSNRIASVNEVLCFIHDEDIHISKVSPDFRFVGFIFSKKVWNHTLIHSHSYLTLASFNPSLEITKEQKGILVEFYEYIYKLKNTGKPDSNPVILNLILGFFFYLGRFYEKWLSTVPKQTNFKIIPKFMFLLFRNYRIHKEVTFYAEQLNMSKSQFSKVIKATTGMSAYKCIEKYLLLKICSLLKNTEKSIKEIAYELNFTDDSHFCKFFRRHMGQSPQEFRNAHFSKDALIEDQFQSVSDNMGAIE